LRTPSVDAYLLVQPGKPHLYRVECGGGIEALPGSQLCLPGSS
jgi:hypothetical protein